MIRVYVTRIAYNPEPETARLRYGYSSMTTPDTLFELDMDTGERRVLKTNGSSSVLMRRITAVNTCG